MSEHDVAARLPIGAFPRTMLIGFAGEPQIRLERLLRRHGHDVLVMTPAQARRCVVAIDLILVSIGDGEWPLGFAELQDVVGKPAIVAATAHDCERDRLRMLDGGCDDHIPLDCGPVELMARIDAVLRWVSSFEVEPPLIELGPLTMDARNREVRLDGVPVHLTRKEYELLHLLASRGGRIVDRVEILDLIWQHRSPVANRTLDTHVSNIRRKIGRWACVTVKGYGLRIGTPGGTSTLS